MSKFFKPKKPPQRRPKTDMGRARIFNYGTAARSTDQREGIKPAENSTGKASRLSQLINYLIAAIILVGVLYMCLLDSSAQVKVIGQKVFPRDKSNYQQGIDEKLKSSVFYRTKLTFDSSKLASDIKAEFPEVNSVNVRLSPVMHHPVVELTLAKPTAKLVTSGRTYILDEDGTALFDEKYASSGLDIGSLLTINDASGQNIRLGTPALTQTQISFIREVIGQSAANDLKARTFTLSGGGTALNVQFDGLKFYVKYNFMADPRQSSGAFVALYQQLKKEGNLPKEYIDVRIPEKAFVK